MSSPASHGAALADDIVERALLEVLRDLSRAEADGDRGRLPRASRILRKLALRIRDSERLAAGLAALLARAVREAGDLEDPRELAAALRSVGRGADMLARMHRSRGDAESLSIDDPRLLREILGMTQSANGFDDEADDQQGPDRDAAAGDPPAAAAAPDGQADGLEARLDEVGRQFMNADLNDLSGLGTISAEMEAIVDCLGADRPLAAAIAQGLRGLAEALILDEAEDLQECFERLGHGIELLQRMQIQFERLGEEEDLDADLRARICAPAAAGDGGSDWADDAEDDAGSDDADDLPAGDAAAVAPPPAAPTAGDLDIDPDLFASFVSEAADHLSAAESTLLSLETDPENDELLNTVFRAFHTVKGAAGFLNLEQITRVAHAVEDIFDSARKKQLKLNPAILDVVLESVDLLKGLIEDVEAILAGGTPPPREISTFLARVGALGRGETPPRVAAPEPAVRTEATPAAVSRPAPGAPRREAAAPQHFVRVGTDKLDQLVNLVGELVISQTQVVQNPEVRSLSNQKLSKDMVQLGKISNDIQEIAMALRMVPIRATFERMARVVRDVARKCGKEVDFAMSGEDTELDKTIVEELVDPLTHMVRNAVDHGIEATAERTASGKSPAGRVELEAYHKGGNIVIELRDDGKGLDRGKLKRKAVERGILRPDEEISDAQANQLIFHAGLSTADKLSDISGRGVGMDVVRKSIESLRGKVDVDSTPGAGSTFRLRLPLTLAIIDGMVIRVGTERYIMPLTSIVRSLRPAPGDVFTVMGRGEMVRVQEELFPLIRFHRLFDIPSENHDPEQALVVLVEAEGTRYCLLVDELLGMQQVVIKALDEELRESRSVSGCAILGDGRVGLILDPNGLAQRDTRLSSGVPAQAVAAA